MRISFSAVFGVLAMVLASLSSRAVESTWEFSVQVSASVQSSPPQIILKWPQDTYMTPNSYTVFRRAPGETSWGGGATLPASATGYTDNNVTVGTPYEYQIVKSTSAYTGYGYVYAGVNVPLTENRGKLLLVVDNTYAAQLTNELARLQQDIVGDGWTVTRIDVARNDSVVNVKNLIKAQYNADPSNVKAAFVFGHVPVPYSGNIVPDGHAPDHQGAWPCDAYYGDMDGTWTDNSVNVTGASEARIRNVPGDGKFDQTDIPSPLELMVGRVDLANMPGRLVWQGPATFPSELELLRNYLNKDHNFRHKLVNLPRRAIVGDYFGVRDGEAFAASGWRNLAPMVDPANVTFLPNKGSWLPTLHTNAYLWAYGCGSGSYTSIGGIGNTGPYNDGVTTELVGSDIEAVFTLLFGSWLGDWDSEDNIQRAVLATSSYGLTCAWSGRPHWFLHHMALGEPIGFGARLTQNNKANGLYRNQVNSCAGQIHIALMGDPTLRMHPVAPPTSVTATPNANNVALSWTAAADTVAGYHVYRATNPNGPFTRLTPALLTSTSYTDTSASGNFIYMVRAVKLESTPSGSYFNPSQGAFAASGSAVAGTDTTPPAVTITAPTANATVSGPTVNVAANASDNVGVAGVQFRLDGANLGTEITTAPYNMTWSAAAVGTHVLTAIARDAAGNQTTSGQVAVTVTGSSSNLTTIGTTNQYIWVEDALPAGALAGEDVDTWNWTGSNPSPVSGAVANQSVTAAGLHQHYFDSATATMPVNPGESLFAYVYLDPANVPSELMLQWNDGSWEHRAYWGANQISYGLSGTQERFYMGALPAAGQWVRLEVPASRVGLEGRTIKGMAFTLYDGRATWDAAGKFSVGGDTTAPVVTITAPTTGAIVSGSSVNVAAQATDDVGVTAVQFKLDGTNLGNQVTSAPYAVAWNPSSASTGTHVLTATGRDAAGNESTSAGVTIMVANTTTLPNSSVAGVKLTLVNGYPTVTWPSTAGSVYCVSYKNEMRDATWATASANITAIGTNTSWTDTEPTRPARRFYVVMRVQ